MLNNKKIMALLLLGMVPSLAQSRDGGDDLFELSLEELMAVKVYSARKSFESMDDLSAYVVVITRSEIEQMGFATLDDLIRHLPGLYLIDTYRDQVIGTRGSIGGSFAFLINGVLSHPSSVPGIRKDIRGRMNIPIESIDRIEFVRGPQGVTYGESAFYGSINVITNDADHKSRFSLALGNNGQQRAFQRISHDYDGGSFTFNAGVWKTDGIGGDLQDTLSADQYSGLHPQMKTSLDGLLSHSNSHFDFHSNHQGFYTYLRYSDMDYGFYANTPSFEDGNYRKVVDRQAAFGYQNTVSEHWSYKIDYSYNRQTLEINSFDFVIPFLDGYQNQEYVQHALDSHVNFAVTDNIHGLVGLWGRQLDVSSGNGVSVMGAVASDEMVESDDFWDTDIYTRIDYSPFDSLHLSAGVRHSTTHDYSVETTDKLTNTTTVINQDTSDTLLPQLGAVYRLNEQNSLKMQYGKANQKPDFPEQRNSDEVIESLELQYLLATDEMAFNSSIFLNKIENLERSTLRLVPDPANPGETMTEVRFDNSGQLEVYGLELIFKHRPFGALSYNASLTYQSTEDVSNPDVKPGYAPRWLAKFDITYSYQSFSFNLLANYVDEMKADWQFNNAFEVERIGSDVDAYVDLTGNIRYNFNQQFYANLYLSNLLDEDIRYPATEFVNFDGGGFAYGRQFLLTLGFAM